MKRLSLLCVKSPLLDIDFLFTELLYKSDITLTVVWL